MSEFPSGSEAPPPEPLRRLTARTAIRLVIELAFVAYLVYYVVAHWHDLKSAWGVSAQDAAAIIGLILISTLVRSWELQVVLKVLGVAISSTESLNLINATTLLNYLPLNAGTIIKARILKKHKALSYTLFVSMMGALSLLTFLMGGLMGLTTVALTTGQLGKLAVPMSAFFCAIIIGPLTVFCIPSAWAGRGEGRLRRIIRGMLEGWGKIRNNRLAMAALAGIGALKLLLIAGRFWVCFEALRNPTSYVACVMFAVVTSFLMIISITPGAIGVREIAISAIVAATGASYATGMFATTLDRVFTLLVAVVLGVPSLGYLRWKKLV